MEEYKLYITALKKKESSGEIEPVMIEQFRELLAEQFDMYYQAWIEHNVELLEKILYDQKYLRKSFSDELKNIPDQIEIMAGQFVQTYNIFNKIYQNEAARKNISDDIRGIEKVANMQQQYCLIYISMQMHSIKILQNTVESL